MRAMWSGHITFGLISIPVGLHAAVESSERVSFRLLHKKDMAPIKYKKFCSEEDIEVGNDEIVNGYEVEKKKYAVVEKEELEEVQKSVGEGERSIDVLQFVDLASLNPLSFEKPYYVTPQKGGEKAYSVLRDALAEARRVGIARFFLRTRPLLAALIPGPEALALEKLLASKRKFVVKTEARGRGEEGKVVDLMEALRRSIGKAGGRAKAKRSPIRKAGAA